MFSKTKTSSARNCHIIEEQMPGRIPDFQIKIYILQIESSARSKSTQGKTSVVHQQWFCTRTRNSVAGGDGAQTEVAVPALRLDLLLTQ